MIAMIDMPDPKQLRGDFDEQTIDTLLLWFRDGKINLDPGFQRRSVWSPRDRRRLIQSILSHYPLPSVFLYKRENRGGKLVYDVIDGKQRLETIFMFSRQGRFKRDAFELKADMGEGLEWIDWRDIARDHARVRHDFLSYKLQIVEVTGALSQIVDL